MLTKLIAAAFIIGSSLKLFQYSIIHFKKSGSKDRTLILFTVVYMVLATLLFFLPDSDLARTFRSYTWVYLPLLLSIWLFKAKEIILPSYSILSFAAHYLLALVLAATYLPAAFSEAGANVVIALYMLLPFVYVIVSKSIRDNYLYYLLMRLLVSIILAYPILQLVFFIATARVPFTPADFVSMTIFFFYFTGTLVSSLYITQLASRKGDDAQKRRKIYEKQEKYLKKHHVHHKPTLYIAAAVSAFPIIWFYILLGHTPLREILSYIAGYLIAVEFTEKLILKVRS